MFFSLLTFTEIINWHIWKYWRYFTYIFSSWLLFLCYLYCISQELRYVHEELLKQKTALQSRIQDRDAEIVRLRTQVCCRQTSWPVREGLSLFVGESVNSCMGSDICLLIYLICLLYLICLNMSVDISDMCQYVCWYI